MTIAIVYSTRTGNTKLLAEAIHEELAGETCLYMGSPNEEALKADRIYVGFWTDKGNCDQDTAAFLQTVTSQEIYLFGTAGCGGNQEYFDKILERTEKHLKEGVPIVGHFMCQGKMPVSVREKYEKMRNGPMEASRIQGMIANFDSALTHPNQQDLRALREAVRHLQ